MDLTVRLPTMVAIVAVLSTTSVEAQFRGTSIFEEPDQLWVGDGVRAPAVADTFALVSVRRFPITELGMAFGYDGPYLRNLDLTIYVYPPPAGVEDPLQSEFEQVVRDIHTYASQRNPAWSVTMRREEPYELELENGELLEGMVAEAEYFRSAQTSRTIAYLFEKSGFLLKYRITYDSGAPRELSSHLDAWLLITARRIGPYPG